MTTLGACTTTESDDRYSGIEKEDISDLTDPTKIDFVYSYKGSSDNWAATYYVYRFKGKENHVTRLFMKYIGDEPTPTGQLSYFYKTEGAEAGNGTLSEASHRRVYNLGQGGGNGRIPSQKSTVSFTVRWNGKSESFELKAAK